MASGKNSFRTLSALALLCLSTTSIGAETGTDALPCATPVNNMAVQSEPIPTLDANAAYDVHLLNATTNPRSDKQPVVMPELLTREEMGRLSETELRDRIFSIEWTIVALFEKLPALRSPAPSVRIEGDCQ